MRDAGPTHEGPWNESGGGPDNLDETVMQGAESLLLETRTQYPPGTAVNRYVVLHEVGAGGMGVVYAAFDPQLNRKIALKILTPKPDQRNRGDRATIRLMREAQAIARLSHPNVVNVYDVGRHGNAVFVAMEFIEGTTLTQWLEKRERTLDEIREVFARAGRGLAAAHAAGLIHRDFKPDNVLVSVDGRVRVLDFGLARADPSHSFTGSGMSLEEDSEDGYEEERSDGVPQFRDFGDSDVLSSPLTMDDAVVGTPRYMAPEQHAGLRVDARGDQFSFCVALYQALFGQEPFPATRLQDLVLLKQEGEVAAIPQDSGVPAWLVDLVLRGLESRPADRWPSIDDLVEALEHDAQAQRRKWLALGGGALLLAAVTASVGHRLGSEDSRPCQDGDTHLAAIWSDEHKQALQESIVGTELPYAEHTWSEVERHLDEDMSFWAETYRDACEATRIRGEQSDELLDLRMTCLQDHLHEVEAVLGAFEQTDEAVVQRAVSIVAALPSLEPCSDAEGLRARLPPPEDEQTRERVQELRQQLRDASAQRAVARMAESRELAEQTLAQAEIVGYEPLRVEAMLAVGIALEQSGEYADAESRLRETVTSSLRIGHDDIAAQAGVQLVSVVGDRLARYDEGLTWYEVALALLDRRAERGVAHASLYNNVGNVWHRKEDNERALEFYERAIAMRAEIVGSDNPTVAAENVNLGNAQLSLGRYEEALASYRRAEDVLTRTLGEGHPQIAMAVVSIGIVYNQTARYTEALEQFQKSLPQFEAWLGPEHLFVAVTHTNIGAALQGLERYDESEAQFRRGQALFEKSLGPEHPEVARCLSAIASVRLEQGRYDEAMRLNERAIELWGQRFDDDADSIVSARASMAELRRLQGDASGAMVSLETLVARVADAELDDVLRANLYHQLAKTRWDVGQPESAVRADLRRARDYIRRAGARGNATAREVDAWEREHAEDDRPRDDAGNILPVAPGSPNDTAP
ncbi:MAG: serine/threonine-protein kinase [Myxococcota bacterium]